MLVVGDGETRELNQGNVGWSQRLVEFVQGQKNVWMVLLGGDRPKGVV